MPIFLRTLSLTFSFDTLQIIDDVRIPNGQWGNAEWLEPITKDFPKHGPRGVTQAIANQEITLDELKKRNLLKLNSIVDIIIEDVISIVYSKGGDYSDKTIKSFVETYFNSEMYKKYQEE